MASLKKHSAQSTGVTGPTKVKKGMLVKAIHALSQLISKRSANTNQLFDANAETMTVIFTLSQIPEKGKMKPVMIPLPHPMFDDKSEVCFISKDPQKKYKELLLRTHPVPGLTKVIGMEKLKKNYKTAEDKRALADAFDLFLCDRNVLEMMPKVLGTIFYKKKKKAPIPVKLHMGQTGAGTAEVAVTLRKAMSGTPFRVPAGPCVGVRIGRCSMNEAHLVENAATVIVNVLRLCESNPVQSISVQATDAPALPVWRRQNTPGGPLDLKKYRNDGTSSSASDTEPLFSGASQTDGTSDLDVPSDAGETLDTLSETGTSLSELDSEVGDVDESSAAESQDLPLLRGTTRGAAKRRRDAAPVAKVAAGVKVGSPKTTAVKAGSPKAVAAMPPPAAKKAKKAKATA